MRRADRWWAMGAAALAFSLVSWAQAPDPAPQHERAERSELAEHVVWSNSRPGETLFIPEVWLQAEARDSLALLPDEREAFESRLRAMRAERLQNRDFEPHCTIREGSWTGPPFQSSGSLLELLGPQGFLVRGTVVDVVAGWGGGRDGDVQTLVYVRVEEILRCSGDCPGRSVYIGDVVAVQIDAGRVEVDGEVLCNETEQVRIPPRGSEVLVCGANFEGHQHYIGSGLLFEVSQGMILPQPYRFIRERVEVPYPETRNALGPSLAACEWK